MEMLVVHFQAVLVFQNPTQLRMAVAKKMIRFRSAQKDDRRPGDPATDAQLGLIQEHIVIPSWNFRSQHRVLLRELLPGEGDGFRL